MHGQNVSAAITDSSQVMNLPPDIIVFREGDTSTDLYFIAEGKVMAFLVNGTQVFPLAYLEKGDFLGEFSFIDGKPRSANIVTTTDCQLIKIESKNVDDIFPAWSQTTAKFLSGYIRKIDEVIKKRRLKPKGTKAIPMLTLEQQRHYYKIWTNK